MNLLLLLINSIKYILFSINKIHLLLCPIVLVYHPYHFMVPKVELLMPEQQLQQLPMSFVMAFLLFDNLNVFYQ